jgi:hypothetical protein
MRIRLLVFLGLAGGLAGFVVGIVVVGRPQVTCVQTTLCRVDLRSGGGCLPVPCDSVPGVPAGLWISILVGILLYLVVGVVVEQLDRVFADEMPEAQRLQR